MILKLATSNLFKLFFVIFNHLITSSKSIFLYVSPYVSPPKLKKSVKKSLGILLLLTIKSSKVVSIYILWLELIFYAIPY